MVGSTNAQYEERRPFIIVATGLFVGGLCLLASVTRPGCKARRQPFARESVDGYTFRDPPLYHGARRFFEPPLIQ
jgi:hypothetical protein